MSHQFCESAPAIQLAIFDSFRVINLPWIYHFMDTVALELDCVNVRHDEDHLVLEMTGDINGQKQTIAYATDREFVQFENEMVDGILTIGRNEIRWHRRDLTDTGAGLVDDCTSLFDIARLKRQANEFHYGDYASSAHYNALEDILAEPWEKPIRNIVKRYSVTPNPIDGELIYDYIHANLPTSVHMVVGGIAKRNAGRLYARKHFAKAGLIHRDADGCWYFHSWVLKLIENHATGGFLKALVGTKLNVPMIPMMKNTIKNDRFLELAYHYIFLQHSKYDMATLQNFSQEILSTAVKQSFSGPLISKAQSHLIEVVDGLTLNPWMTKTIERLKAA